jgi:XTP/dITP diphosphohydrolase
VPRLTLLVASPRVAPGLLSRDAWVALAGAERLAADLAEPLVVAIADAGLPVETVDGLPSGEGTEDGMPSLARALVARAARADTVWIGSADGDPGLSDAIASEVSRLDDPPVVEVLVGSWDVPGSRLLDVVAVMDRLRSPGGCPWDAEQTHESLLPYLEEEAAEYAEAVRSGDRVHMAEELGDVLLQVAFHARVAEDATAEGLEPFDIDDVADHLVAKLVRRHPHVFGDSAASTPEEVAEQWERIKAEEAASRAAGPASRAAQASR